MPMLDHSPDFESLLGPQTHLELALISHPDFLAGYAWGTPRFGHPEGKVGFHVREVLDNIDRLAVDVLTRERLRIAALSHDTFKYREFRHGRRVRHHGLLAREFLEPLVDDVPLLDVIELHDEAFYIWRHLALERCPDKARRRMDNLLHRLQDHLELYFLFYQCDTETGDKIQSPLHWFRRFVREPELRHNLMPAEDETPLFINGLL
jgi:hypothetical protein